MFPGKKIIHEDISSRKTPSVLTIAESPFCGLGLRGTAERFYMRNYMLNHGTYQDTSSKHFQGMICNKDFLLNLPVLLFKIYGCWKLKSLYPSKKKMQIVISKKSVVETVDTSLKNYHVEVFFRLYSTM